ncbi:molybdopterin molybdotransferase MoeA [Aeoliella sp. ICT_H6.2]|uniref:Molybdopterin molybdenumtransferase n=1 Tax=Aeoliella straminimaris TaxID=2954799 RepID=A0A9X2F6A7_9BACT|nr:gephyrin-like molybdotransferase Glp [Aeoliella straminimaris]MCO6043025.1 molybdopterin molybdotransferase MoeA [Aeoliella straminimaris]
MLTVDEALQLVGQHAAQLAPIRIRLRDALGLVLADEVTSDVDSPPYNKAMMDGFAVVASDRSPTRTIIESIMAGDVPRRPIRPGTTARVMTGAPLPDGATAVVPVEQTELVDDRTVRLEWIDPPPGKHIMPQGLSMSSGQCIAAAGRRIDSITMAVLAEAGAAVLSVVPRPTVSVLTTGNELVSVDERPAAGQIRNSNGPLLTSALCEGDYAPSVLPSGRDELDELVELAQQGLEADVLLVTGGVSAGVKDLVPAALAQAGVQQVFHKVALKPGKPLWFGIVPREHGPPRLVFGLPGNPVSGFVCFHLFVIPALAVLAGRADSVVLRLSKGTSMGEFAYGGGREMFRPAYVDAQQRVEIFPWHGSADLAGMVRANCLVRLSETGVELAAGDRLEYVRLPGINPGK